ncbi:MAG: PQQ-binding-like beta-propeller repeat protein, partial [Thermoanaerobaculia bacterium]
MRRPLSRISTTLLLGVLAAGVALGPVPSLSARQPAGHDWPGFLGPSGDGRSSENGISKRWPEEGPPLVWQRPVGEGYAAPTVAAGRLYLFDRSGDAIRLTCLDARTGEEIWHSEYPSDYEDMYGYSNGPRAVPVVDGGLVYTFGPAGRLRSHRADDGSLVWEVDTAARFGVVQNFFGAASAPVVEGDLLITAIGGSPDASPGIQSGRVIGNGSGIVAFDKRTGEVRYAITDELASYSSPSIVTIADRRWGFLLARGGLIGFEPASGEVDFHFPFRARKLESVNASNPVVVEDTVFITESYGPGSALLRVKPDGYEVVRRDSSRRDQSMSCHWMTPIHHEGTLYGSAGQASGEAELRAVDYETGQILWSEPGLGRATLLYVDGHLLVFTEWGRLLLVEATPERYNVVADAVPLLPESAAVKTGSPAKSSGETRTEERIHTRAPSRQLLRYPAWSPPVLSRGILYLR